MSRDHRPMVYYGPLPQPLPRAPLREFYLRVSCGHHFGRAAPWQPKLCQVWTGAEVPKMRPSKPAPYPIDPPDPITALRFRMEQQGLKSKDLAP